MKVNDISVSKIIRSKRKSVSMKITPEAELVVYAPNFISNHKLHSILIEKYNWIKKNIKIVKTNQLQFQHMYKEDEIFYYLNEEYRLAYNSNSLIFGIDPAKHQIIVNPDFDISQQIKIIYKDAATREVLKIAYRVANQHKKYPEKFKISSAEQRWGSCSSKKVINLSYKLVLCKKEFIEYVVVHELAHLTEMNHSKKFWTLVQNMMPDYKGQLQWVKDNNAKLTL